ncbi:unnamed protein product [Oppiella nova]|uniref:Small ribosomal subunit protein mS35 mitochondrial conserved domain-containing protein n=1 Tax=Oppiella nova TaxID=334625 RepID=A0A7R9LCZ0_9ACAR|nr:unnamed protein product [Oppiella nova]CAG2162314.1 unnamed protein product [Oppiella nova]
MANHVFNQLCPHKRFAFWSTNPYFKFLRLCSTGSETNVINDWHQSVQDLKSDPNEESFPKLNLIAEKTAKRAERKNYFGEIRNPRYKRMKTSQDWTSVWPTARVFHPSTVPLPLHMGWTIPDSAEVPTGKYHNPELLKIPNFLHLSPLAIQKHCEALKPFCTQWPKGLETDRKCDKHFPIEIKTQEFVFSGTSIRWPAYRIVELSLKMSDLPLDDHSRDKMRRLLMEKYDAKSDTIIITASKCPTRRQNYEYAVYLLTAVFFESLKVEDWEAEKAESDWEHFYWSESQSKKSIVSYMKQIKPDLKEEDILNDERIKSFAESVSRLQDQKEDKINLENYKKNVLQIIF